MQFSFRLEENPILPRVRNQLLALFGPQRDEVRLDPVSQLVNAILSPKTRDEVSGAAFERLAWHYRSWDLLADAAPAVVERLIRPVTFPENKAIYLPAALRMIRARQGALDLDFLADWDEEMALQWLRGLPGVGPKVAATTLNFSSLRRRAFAVDTHLLRVGKRLGLLSPNIDHETGHDAYARLILDDWTADDLYELHWLIKDLGQRICTDAVPFCSRCPLQDMCPRGLATGRTGIGRAS